MGGANANIEKLKNLWRDRKKIPIKVAQIISEISQKKELSPYSISIIVGAHPSEVAAYIDLANLTPTAQAYFVDYNLPISLAIDLAIEDEETQLQVLSKLCSTSITKEDVINQFLSLLYDVKKNRDSWRDLITGPQMMHLASKAKNADVLSKRERRALASIGKRLSQKGSITKNQKAFVDSILEKCVDNNLLTESCFNENCPICKKIAGIVRGNDGY